MAFVERSGKTDPLSKHGRGPRFDELTDKYGLAEAQRMAHARRAQEHPCLT